MIFRRTKLDRGFKQRSAADEEKTRSDLCETTRNQRNYIGRFYELVAIKYTYPGYVIRSGYTSDELRDCF